MNALLKKIEQRADLKNSVEKCESVIKLILQNFITNFPEFTDHSFEHSKSVLNYASLLLKDSVDLLNEDEIYITIMACYLHDIGMCPTDKMKEGILNSTQFQKSGKSFEDYLRDIHHELSYEYIMNHWNELKIINKTYAKAIALVGMGHRKLDLLDVEKYNPDFAVKTGNEFICLPYLTAIVRLADELDITNDRTPDLLYNEYMPKNKISKREWEKHRDNYLVNFQGDVIRITAECNSKDLYYLLLKHYKKIEDVLNYVQKVIRMLPGERRLLLKFTKVEKHITPVGFIPKEIGFSFDLQNTINTFIGDNIYRDKSVALRECLQNSIDTCRYRALNTKEYKPEIIVTLDDKTLSILDNGQGMDEHIVENYFAKLAKSYYTEKNVSDRFESISQFGVGIFSYFLICDYFDVETKMTSKSALKFRVLKDQNSYFHFYDNTIMKETGTIITFYLREELPFDILLEQIKYYVRFIEFPISLKYKDRKELIVSQKFQLDTSQEIKSRIKLTYSSEAKSLDIITKKRTTPDYEGICGMIINKNKKDGYLPTNLSDMLRYRSYRGSEVEISQKGIFVNNNFSTSISHLIGKINIKKKKSLDISRNRIKDDNYLISIISDFESEIVAKLFKSWNKRNKKSRASLTREFIRYYLKAAESLNNTLLDIFSKVFYFSIYHNNKYNYLSLKEILKLDRWIIVHDRDPFTKGSRYNFNDINTIYEYFNIPLLLENNDLIAETILELFISLGLEIEITANNSHWYFLIRNSKATNNYFSELFYRYKVMPFYNNNISAFPNFNTVNILNLNHPVINYFYTNSQNIQSNQSIHNLCDEFLSILHDFMFNFHNSGISKPKEYIKSMNSILNLLNKHLNTNFKISKDDFPNWMNEKL